MPSASEGVRRLSLFSGGVVTLLWFGWIFLATEAFTKIRGEDFWPLFVGSLAVSFLVPFAFVRAAAWVVSGFTDKKE